MTRAHDMGGRFGDGPVSPELENVVFDSCWHARALAITLACGSLGLWNIDASRHARECLPPKDYFRFSYYERWLAGLTDMLVENGALTAKELMMGEAIDPSDLTNRKLVANSVNDFLTKGSPTDRLVSKKSIYKCGDLVKTRAFPENMDVTGGHTRLPSYAAGATGYVLLRHGAHVLPDSNAHGLGEAAEPLYAVAFKASDLWAQPNNSDDEVILDLWQSYLVLA